MSIEGRFLEFSRQGCIEQEAFLSTFYYDNTSIPSRNDINVLRGGFFNLYLLYNVNYALEEFLFCSV